MQRSLCVALLPVLLVIFINAPLFAQDRYPITRKHLEVMVQNVDWIIQGQVMKVEPVFVDRRALDGEEAEANDRRLVVTEITMKIEKMIAGEYEGNELMFVLEEGDLDGFHGRVAGHSPMKVKVGDHAIVGIVPNTRGTGYNILDNRMTFFRLEDSTLVPYQEELYMTVERPLEVIAKTAKEREMPEVFKAADLICTGTVKELIDPEGRSPRIVVLMDEVLKGTLEKSEVVVDVSGIFQPFRLQKPGYRVMLFLRKCNSRYKTVAGVNGYYVVKGDQLSRGHNLPLNVTVGQLKDKIKAWKEAER